MYGIQLIILLIASLGLARAQSCSESDRGKVDSFSSTFFSCYDENKALAGICFANSTDVSLTCAVCVQVAITCTDDNCASECQNSPKTPPCLECAKKSCQTALNTCVGSPDFSIDPCTSFFCNQPAYVLPVIIAGSVLGAVILITCVYCIMRRSRDPDSPGCFSCGCCGVLRCCSSQLKDDERIEERLRRQNQERIDKLNRNRDNSSASSINRLGRSEVARHVGMEYPAGDDNFEMSAGFGPHDDIEASPLEFEDTKHLKRFGSKKAIVDKTEHNVRASKLPEGFRIQSVQPGLTPEMIFSMDTVKNMKEANAAASAVPAAVIASHKALKMMGVNESDVQKPYSEPVTSRVERLAKAANKQGLMSGGATANLGNQIAEQFAIKRKAAEERAEAYRQAELRKEEARIRSEISRENKTELAEKRRTLRESGKLSPEDAKRLSLAAAARRSAKAAGETAAAAGNKLKDFLERAEKS